MNGYLLTTTFLLVIILAASSLLFYFIIPAFSKLPNQRKSARKALRNSMLIGTSYAGFCHLLARIPFTSSYFEVVSLGYVFLLPFVVGYLTVSVAPIEEQRSWTFAIFAPLGTATLTLLCSLLVGWEGSICLIVGGLVFIPLASIGGVGAAVLGRLGEKRRLHLHALPLVLVAPLLSSAVETSFSHFHVYPKAKTEIHIRAPKEIVWKNIVTVPKITEELDGVFYKLGFPKPISADLSFEGIGGVRVAKFERGLQFIETINEWIPLKSLAFEIAVDPKTTPLTTLDEHVTVGGKYFDVLRGRYEIEELSESEVILHLESNFRVSTSFNFYAHWWARFLMMDIQDTILKVIRERCERGEQPEGLTS